MGPQHEVERAWFGQILAATIWALFDPVFLWQLIGAQSRFTGATIHHRVAECVFVPAGFERGAVSQDRAVEADDIIAFAHHDAPPIVFQIALQLDSERAVIPDTVKAAIDLARLENETAPFAEA